MLLYQTLQITYKMHFYYMNNIVSSGTFMYVNTPKNKIVVFAKGKAESFKYYMWNIS